ncbi:tetratricopeptide repeat protein [Ulvibacterium sp.]|uniref:tetratricopeptide repeat protein n=1 Tax=Ulvibacterium sp. TaxID=2665914 RepID=UPI003CC587E2
MKNHFLLALVVQNMVLATCSESNKNSIIQKNEADLLIDSLANTDLPKSDKIRSIRNAGFSYYYNGDIDSAHTMFTYTYLQDPTDIENMYAVALVNSIHGNYDQSLAHLNKIIHRDSIAKLSAYGSMAMIYSFRGEEEKARNLVDTMLKSNHDKIRREAYSIASVLSIKKDSIAQAIDFMKLRIPISKKLYTSSSPRLEHPYWDYHLIGNIYLTEHLPDSAAQYFDEGLALVDSKDNPKTISVIKDDYTYFRSMYLLQKGFYDDSYTYFKTDFKSNKNGYGGIWARILIEKNLPDSALTILNTYCRNGYYKKFLEGKVYLESGKFKKADTLFKEVLGFHQVGEWYWQHEYALICKEIRDIYLDAGKMGMGEKE